MAAGAAATQHRARYRFRVQSEPIAASSSRNAWIFPAIDAFFGGCNCEYNYALRWTGHQWRTSRFPAKIGVTAAAALSPSAVWAFGWTSPRQNSQAQFPYAGRYNGHSWHRVWLPGAALAVGASASRDMWAIGPTPKTADLTLARQVMIAMHCTGRSWHVIRMPKIMTRIRQHSLDGAFVAAASHQQALGFHRDLGNLAGVADVLNNLGQLSLRTSATRLARDHHNQALALARDIGVPLEEARALEGIGRSHLQDGHLDQGLDYLCQAFGIFQRIGSARAQLVQETLRQHGNVAGVNRLSGAD